MSHPELPQEQEYVDGAYEHLERMRQVEAEDLSDEYTVWLFGSRRQIGAIMRELAARS